MDKDLLIEALYIAKDDFDFDGEHEKSEAIESYIKEIANG
jgi:hypothetical protein